MHAVHWTIRWLERCLVTIAAIMLLVIMLIATVDVALRYLFNAPLGWSYDLISMYLMAGLFFFALSDTLEKHSHIAVDLLHLSLPPRLRHAAEIPGYLLALVVLVAITWLSLTRTIESYAGGDVVAGRFDWPTWISHAFVFIGFSVLALRVVFRLAGHFASVLTGRSVIGLPPIAGKDEDR